MLIFSSVKIWQLFKQELRTTMDCRSRKVNFCASVKPDQVNLVRIFQSSTLTLCKSRINGPFRAQIFKHPKKISAISIDFGHGFYILLVKLTPEAILFSSKLQIFICGIWHYFLLYNLNKKLSYKVWEYKSTRAAYLFIFWAKFCKRFLLETLE